MDAQPPTEKPTATKRRTPASMPSLRERSPISPTSSNPARLKLACVVPLGAVGGTCLREATGPAATVRRIWPCVPITAPLAHAAALARMVNVALTALLAETVALGKEKHAFEMEGLLEPLQPMVPV